VSACTREQHCGSAVADYCLAGAVASRNGRNGSSSPESTTARSPACPPTPASPRQLTRCALARPRNSTNSVTAGLDAVLLPRELDRRLGQAPRSPSPETPLKSTIVLAALQQALPQKHRPRARIRRRCLWRIATMSFRRPSGTLGVTRRSRRQGDAWPPSHERFVAEAVAASVAGWGGERDHPRTRLCRTVIARPQYGSPIN
jgi:hypothetical protein